MKQFKSFYSTVDGNEGSKCNYTTRLDTFGCGCQHNCNYCYARSLLEFRGLWNKENPAIIDLKEARKVVRSLPKNAKPIRLGGMTDCFQPMEKKYPVTREIIKTFENTNHHYLIVTKSNLVADYTNIMSKKLAHIQITLTCTDDELYKKLDYEQAPLPSERIVAIEKLNELGYDVQIRLSPYIPEYIQFDKLANIKCDKMLVEFLRISGLIKKAMPDDFDYSPYTVKQGGYMHLPLKRKIELLDKIKQAGYNGEMSVCEDEDEAYKYWQNNFNVNKNDCCNLRF